MGRDHRGELVDLRDQGDQGALSTETEKYLNMLSEITEMRVAGFTVTTKVLSFCVNDLCLLHINQ